MSQRNPLPRVGAILSLILLLIPLTSGAIASGSTRSSSTFGSNSTWAEIERPHPSSREPPEEGPWVVRAYYRDRQMADQLASWREPWEVHHDQGYLVLDVNRVEYERLLEAGFRLEIDEQSTYLLHQPQQLLPGQDSGIPGYPCYLTVEETFATAQEMVTQYPQLATWIDVGDSWEKTEPGGEPGYDMRVLQLTSSKISGPKPILFVMASVHAREYAPAELSTRFARLLLEQYDVDPDITWLLDYHQVHLMLNANPDGRKWAEQGYPWRKNTDNKHCADQLTRGVDLNRNFGFGWGCCGGSSSDECSEIFRGPEPVSEPETQAIQDYVRAQFPDQREEGLSAAAPVTATGLFLDLHSYGELVLWPWGFTETPAPNGAALQTLGRKLAFLNSYTPQQAYALYLTDGTTDDFAYGELGLASYTFELGTTFFQDCATFEDRVLADNIPALIYAAKVSRAPYATPAGPDVLDVIVSPPAILAGSSVTLTAKIDDTRFSSRTGSEPVQNIRAAEYYIDVPPWSSSTAYIYGSVLAADGAFDQAAEMITARIDTTGMNEGRHIIFVRGKDGEGNWGAVSAGFLFVNPPWQAFLPIVSKQK